MEKGIGICLLLLNLAAFFAMFADKRFARAGMRRIPERTFFLLAACGGSPGAIAGMLLFRHKTRKSLFFLGLPLILVLQIGATFFLTK